MSNNKYETLKFLTLITQIGLTFIISVLMCLYIGMFLSDYTGYNIIRIIFIIIGVITGFIASAKIIFKFIEK